MVGRVRVVAALIVIAVATGCTPVQKGTAIGSGVGGAAGAAVGHYASTLGGVPGALIGASVGAAGGALMAESSSAGPSQEELDAYQRQAEKLAEELQLKDQRLASTADQLEKEKQQQKAILEAYEKLRQNPGAISADLGGDIQVTSDGDSFTYTMLSEVLFDSGKADLKSDGQSTLERAARSIREEFPNAEIEVRGHTDNVPIRYSNYRSNWDLSCARAVSVVRYLIEKEGFDPQKLRAVGCGETRPVAPNTSAEGRRKNRRAEIVVRPRSTEMARSKDQG